MNRCKSTPRSRPPWLVAFVCAFVLVLAGCGGLPTDATPRAGEPVLGQPRQVIQVRPEGPSEDARPEQIVRGFLLANVSFADSHEVARTFLTSSLASSWVPTSEILIYPREPELSSPDEGVVEAKVPVQGTLDGDGRLTQLPSGSTSTERFSVTRVEGQWRISGFPEGFGLWLSANAFQAQYRTASINYLSSTQNRFVPETRWFSRDDGLPTALARALIAPVPEYLADAVRTGVREQTNLVAGAVPLDPATGTATVNLQGAGLTEEPDQVRMLYTQFFSTLTQAAGVRNVQLQINGQPLRAPGVTGPVSSLQQLGMPEPDAPSTYAVLRIGSSLTAVDPSNYRLLDLPEERQEELNLPSVSSRWAHLAMDGAAKQFAAIDGTGSVLWRRAGQDSIERRDIGKNLTAPTFDRSGFLWLAGRSATGPALWAIDADEGLSSLARPVEAEWLAPQTEVDFFEVAPDGQRAVIVTHDGDRQAQASDDSGADTYSLALTAIVRDEAGRPTALTPPEPIAPTITSVTDVSWASQESLAVLGQQDPDEEVRPYLLPVGSWLQPLQVEPDAEAFVGMPTDEGFKLAVVTSDGRINTPEGAGWYPYRNGDDLVVPAG